MNTLHRIIIVVACMAMGTLVFAAAQASGEEPLPMQDPVPPRSGCPDLDENTPRCRCPKHRECWCDCRVVYPDGPWPIDR